MGADYTRPDPDELLARVQAEEESRARGKLKVFLGYAAGVGKTYAMLDAARELCDRGVDVIVGWAETHGRAETEALLEGLEVVPQRQVEYRGATLAEMDLDAVEARRPQLALVDELAHTNAPGSRHPKRYLDVEDLLASGIDVYTTLNIQHIESLNDVVAQITGVTVRETVPDSILDRADQIELVDLPPYELLQRLREGKVYVPDQAARAIDKFFRQGNLSALREMALRRTADRVDEQMRAYMQMRAIPGPWPAGERLLVCITPSPLSERLIRAGRRMAAKLDAEWYVIYVETPARARPGQPDRDRVARMLRLAEELGAKTATLPGHNAAETIARFARAHNVTQLVAGRPLRSRLVELWRGSFVDQLIRKSGNIDVYIISSEGEATAPVQAQAQQPHAPWPYYLAALALVAAVSLLGHLLSSIVDPTNLVMFYLLAVVIAAVFWGHGPSILVALLSVAAFDFFFVPPRLTLAVSDTQYLLTFMGLLVVGLVISSLAARARDQAEAAARREADTATLLALSRDLTTAVELDEIVRKVVSHMGETFGREVFLLFPQGDALVPHASSPGLALEEDELAVATWSFQHGEPAGRGTDTLPAADGRYLPLRTPRGVIGVLGVRPAGDVHLTPDQRRLMDAFAGQAALAAERAQLAQQAAESSLLLATQKLQTALLNSISHDLRTPLVSITGALSSLRDDAAYLDEAARRGLAEMAWGEAERLNRLVGNLLEMTRLEAGALRVVPEPSDPQDVVGAALAQLARPLQGHPVVVDVPAGLPLVPIDPVLIVRVLTNILDNALKYSAAGTPIEVSACDKGSAVEVAVADRGIGIPPEDLERVFDKFYRVHRADSVGGTGLGLSICRGIVEAHGGRIWARNREGGGTVVTLALPLGGERPPAEAMP